ncbi:MAG: hypothetical protein WCB27_05000 [Thermoguttaceae bacterium]|jgi:hypothetical protein
MKSRTTERFRKSFSKLPAEVQGQANRAFALWRQTPNHPSLQFKRIHGTEPIYAVRVGIHWRALATVKEDRAIWFWIGHHSEYDHLISQ